MSVPFVLHDEDYRKIKAASDRLCVDANAHAVFVVAKDGQLIAASGDADSIDTTSLASLVAGELAATSGLARLLGEKDFNVLFHEGESENVHISLVAERGILVVIFDRRTSLGLVRLRVKKATTYLATIFHAIERRAHVEGQEIFPEITEADIDNLFSD